MLRWSLGWSRLHSSWGRQLEARDHCNAPGFDVKDLMQGVGGEGVRRSVEVRVTIKGWSTSRWGGYKSLVLDHGYWKPCLPLPDGHFFSSGQGCLPGCSELICYWVLQVCMVVISPISQCALILVSQVLPNSEFYQPMVRREQFHQNSDLSSVLPLIST